MNNGPSGMQFELQRRQVSGRSSSSKSAKKGGATALTLTAAAPESGCAYTAEQPSAGTSSFKYALGCFQPKKNELTLIEVPHIYTMTAGSRSQNTFATKSELQTAEQRFAMKSELVTTFGSKKSKKSLQNFLENTVRVPVEDKATQQMLKTAIATSASPAKLEADGSASSSQAQLPPQAHYLPEFDAEATEAEDIYNIHSIFSTEAWDTLDFQALGEMVAQSQRSDELEQVKEAAGKEEDDEKKEPEVKYPRYIHKMANDFAFVFPSDKSKTTKKKIKNAARCLLALNYCVRFKMSGRFKEEAVQTLGCSESFGACLLDKFTERQLDSRTGTYR